MNLYELASEFKQAESDLNEMLYSEEISEQVVTDTLDSLMGSFEQGAVELVKMIKNEQAFESGVNNEINRLKAKQLASRKKVQRLKCYLLSAMESMEVGKIKSSIATFSIRSNQGSVRITNEELIPGKFKSIKTEEVIDKKALREAIESGEVPEIVATIERSKSLIIK